MSLPKINRLNKDFFKKNLKKEAFFESKKLSLKVFSEEKQKNFKVAVVLSSKRIPEATIRNKTKRTIKETAQSILKRKNNNKVFVFYIKKPIEKISKKRIVTETIEILKRAIGNKGVEVD